MKLNTLKLINHILVVFLMFGALLCSVCVGFTAFHMIIAIIGTCHFIMGNSIVFVSSPVSTFSMIGSIIIGFIVYAKTYFYLEKFIKRYKDLTRIKEDK